MIRPDIPVSTRIHMIGIGGAGVSGLAVVMAQMGYRISGSDLRPDAVREKLGSLGITIFAGHDAGHVAGADLVVASAAVPGDNPELLAAESAGIPIISRAKMLGQLMDGNYGIAVAGTHGKTTTTSMLAMVLESAGLDPTVVVGGDLQSLNGNAKLGGSDIFVAEACEAFNSFLELSPHMAIVTNIEADHLDCHGDLNGVMNSFRRFLSRMDEGGCAVMCADCENVRQIIPTIDRRVVTYGLAPGADCSAHDVNAFVPEPTFHAEYMGRALGEFSLRVPGLHNVRNALSTIAIGCELGADPEAMRDALAEFRGAGRRFEVLGTAGGITVLDDYAHHPTEVRVTLEAAKTFGRRVVAVFQPHLYSRTQQLAGDFAESLREADVIVLTEIYPAREKPVPGVSASMITDMINGHGSDRTYFIPDKDRVSEELMPILRSGDLVVVMGAGDIRSAGESLLTRLGETPGATRSDASRKDS